MRAAKRNPIPKHLIGSIMGPRLRLDLREANVVESMTW
jgi:hypothetical protein